MMKKNSLSENFKFGKYKVLLSNRGSRYGILKDIVTGGIVIADMIDFKVLYELNAKDYRARYIRPRSVVINIPRIEYLDSANDMAYIYFLKEYEKECSTGIIVFENGVLSIFNRFEESFMKIFNIKKAVLLMYYTLQLEDIELFSGYNLKLRYVSKEGRLEEILIDVLNKRCLRKYGGTFITGINFFKHSKFFTTVERVNMNIEKDSIRQLNLLELEPLYENAFHTMKAYKEGMFRFSLIRHYHFLK